MGVCGTPEMGTGRWVPSSLPLVQKQLLPSLLNPPVMAEIRDGTGRG